MTKGLESPITPSLAETIRTVMDRQLVQVHTCMPGKIVEYDKDQQRASIQIQLMTKNESTGSIKPRTVIPNIPVVHPRAHGGKTFIHMPMQAGDDVLVVICERSLDNWKTKGGMTDPADRRKFNLTDAFAIPGGSAFPDAFKVETNDAIEITNQDASLQVFPTGKFKIKNQDNELLDIISTLMQLLFEARTNTLFGLQPLINFQSYQVLKTKVDTLKG